MTQTSVRSAFQWLEGSIDPCLISRMSDLATLSIWLESQLPSPLNQECHLINLRGSTLVIGAFSPVWAARVRFQCPRLLATIERELPFVVRKIQVKVLPAKPQQKQGTYRAMKMTSDAARLLLQTARNLDHPRLSAALSRLAAHAPESEQIQG